MVSFDQWSGAFVCSVWSILTRRKGRTRTVCSGPSQVGGDAGQDTLHRCRLLDRLPFAWLAGCSREQHRTLPSPVAAPHKQEGSASHIPPLYRALLRLRPCPVRNRAGCALADAGGAVVAPGSASRSHAEGDMPVRGQDAGRWVIWARGTRLQRDGRVGGGDNSGSGCPSAGH